MREGLTPEPIAVTPLAIHDTSQSDAAEFVNSLCVHNAGIRIPVVGGGADGGPYEVLVLPRAGQAKASAGSPSHPQSITRRAIRDYDFEPSRILYNASLNPEKFKLCISPHSSYPANSMGYIRLGRSIPLDPEHVSSIVVNEEGYIKDVSWDETSGRVLVLLSTWSEDDSEGSDFNMTLINELLIIDLL